jgi:hypothetical protein
LYIFQHYSEPVSITQGEERAGRADNADPDAGVKLVQESKTTGSGRRLQVKEEFENKFFV